MSIRRRGAAAAALGAAIVVVIPVVSLAEASRLDTEGAATYAVELGRYRQGARSYGAAIRAMAVREAQLRGRALEGEYRRQLRALEDAEASARRNAIEVLESFIETNPRHAELTPDVMLRLAELRYEEASERYLDEVERYDEVLERRGGGEDVQLPDEPVRDLSGAISLLRRLVAEFPASPRLVGALYLLGHCLYESDEREESRLAWLQLVCGNYFRYEDRPTRSESDETTPPVEGRSEPFVDPYTDCEPVISESRHSDEVWLRIGEHHFDFDYSRNGLERAISAYRHAMANPDGAYYDHALFRLALCHHRSDRIEQAVTLFVQLIERADLRATTARTPSRDVRPEALRFVGLSFAEGDWDGDFEPDAATTLQRLQDPEILPQDRAFTRDVYLETADILFEMANYTAAVEVYGLFLARWPMSIEAPSALRRIAEGHRRDRRFDASFEARARLARYGPDSECAEANRAQHPARVLEAEHMGRNELYAVAARNQAAGSAWLDEGTREDRSELIREATNAFRIAARAYDLYLELYPRDPGRYETTFNAAGAHYFAGAYCEAAQRYAWVRDSNLDDRLRQEAARGYARALERAGGEGSCDAD